MEIGQQLQDVEPASPDAEALRRKHFKILDHTLDAGEGPLPFRGLVAEQLQSWIADYNHEGLSFEHWVIMPNHLHLLTNPIEFSDEKSFQTTWRRFKGRSSRFIGKQIQHDGPIWQDSLYDRWVRNKSEFDRWVAYFRNNPVKAKLVQDSADYRYLK